MIENEHFLNLVKEICACSSLAERFSDKEEVEGSIPSTRTIWACSLVVEHLICNEEIVGSIPTRSTDINLMK